MSKKPELLSPAGDADCLKAAIENGADAVYFGLQEYNARHRAANFSLGELGEIMARLHRQGVRGYLTLNTLLFSSELEEFEATARAAILAGVDALIVQDIGALRLLREICPDVELHASTQMTVTSSEGIELIEELGVKRVILARELSIPEIKRIRKTTTMSLEVFVHGALCVAYSGQCLTSEALGSRSANRGQCAQACRLPYDLICDGEHRDLGEYRYLLSPQDLAGYEVIPDLIEAGVSCFKIEGRLKSADYVANVTRHYRRAIDEAWEGRPKHLSIAEVRELELSFSRGFSPGWLKGNDHKALVKGLSPKKRGVFLGPVVSVRGGRIVVDLQAPAKPGDGVVFDSGNPESDEPGGRIYEIFQNGRRVLSPVEFGLVELAFGRTDLDVRQVKAGNRVWKTDDPALTKRLRQTFEGGRARRRLRVDFNVVARAGEPLVIEARTSTGGAARAQSDFLLSRAVKHPMTEDWLRDQLSRLGATVFEMGNLTASIVGEPMVPLSLFGRLRHEVMARLDEAVAASPTRRVDHRSVVDRLRPELPDANRDEDAIGLERSILHVLCRNRAQTDALLSLGHRSLYIDFHDIREHGPAVRAARSAGASVFVATPRIQKPAEGPLVHHLLRAGPDGLLARNLGAVLFCKEQGVPFIADFSLNAANELAGDYFHQCGALRITASYDLNRDQLLELADRTPARWLEVVVHQHMPMFHMEHCVFCAVLSPGTNRTNCGRPCDRHEVLLRDRVGMSHPLKADVGCRNTLFNAVPQSAAEVMPLLLQRGVRNFRIELLDESPIETERIVRAYGSLLDGQCTGREVWTLLRASNAIGVTRGPLDVIQIERK